MEQRPIDPADGLYPAAPDYAHALEVRGAQRFLFVSGTMGLDPDGRAPDGIAAQLDRVWSNIRLILAEARMTVDDIVRVTSYLRDAAFAEANKDARLAALGGRRVPTTVIVVGTLSQDWLVEIEVVAAAG